MLLLPAPVGLPSWSSVKHPNSNWRQSRPSNLPNAFSKNVRSRQVVRAARVQWQGQRQQQWTHSDGAHAGELGPTVDRRKAAFTYKPTQELPGPSSEELGQHHSFRKPQEQQQQQRGQQRQQKRPQHTQHTRKQSPQQHPTLQPDSSADDLDALAAQAATLLTTTSSSFPAPAAAAALPVQPGLIYNVPEQEPAGAAAAALIASRKPRYSQSDKLHLTVEAARDIARRLRKAGPPKPGQPVVRVFRYGIDDLRLYKALDLAGLEGRVVVVDSMQFADAVITTRNKRTGKAVNLAVARRAAASAGVPYLQLKAVSPQRLLEALGPLLGLQQDSTAVPAVQQDGVRSMQYPLGSAGQQQQQQQQLQDKAGLSHVLQNAQGLRLQPRLLRWEELEGDGSEELLQLLWGPQVAAGNAGDIAAADNSSSSSSASSSSSSAGNAGSATAVVVGADPRWLAWRASQAGPCSPAAVLELVRGVDIEDVRDEMVPANPTERAGEKHKLLKPLRHGSRLKRKRLLRYLRSKQVPW